MQMILITFYHGNLDDQMKQQLNLPKQITIPLTHTQIITIWIKLE